MTIGTTWESINSAFCLAVRSLSSGTNFLSSRPRWPSLGLQMTGSRPQTSSKTAQSPARKPGHTLAPHVHYRDCWAQSGKNWVLFPWKQRTALSPLTSEILPHPTLHRYLPFPPVSYVCSMQINMCFRWILGAAIQARRPFCLKSHGTEAGEIRWVGKGPAEKAWGPEFKAQDPCKEKLGTVAHVCNPNAGEMETRDT